MEKTFIASILKLMERDLIKLQEEISLYPSEESIWRIAGDIKNSGGNLCLHLCGNLQHYIGSVLGKTTYIRNRDNEFAAKGTLKTELVAEIQKTRKTVASTLTTLNTSILESEYPEKVFAYEMTTLHFLIHLTAHLEYHLGQINYHRRLLATHA
jgi:uncharacterized damage-inducible protein DinB